MIQQDFHDSMKKLTMLLSLWLGGFMQVARCEVDVSYNSNDWPQHILKFSSEGTLKDIFDAGIRPYRFPRLEKSSLGFKHVRLIVELRSGERLPAIAVDWGGIKPLAGGLLSSVEMTSPDLSIQEAESAIIPFLNKGKRTVEQLRGFLNGAKSNPFDYDDPYRGDPSKFAISWTETNGPAYDVFLKKSFQPEKPVSIALKVSFFPIRTPLQQRSFYDVPIPPPPGYEDVSMDAPRNFGPDSAVEIARSKGLPITGDRRPEEYERQWREANGLSSGTKSSHNAANSESDTTESFSFLRWLIGILCIMGVAVVIRRWKGK